MEEDHLISTLQVTLAATRAEAHRQRQRRRQRFMDQLLQLEPLERLKRTVWLQAHGSPRYSRVCHALEKRGGSSGIARASKMQMNATT